MTADRFDIRVRHRPGVAVLDLRGEIDASAERDITRGYDEAEAAHPGVILLNFAEVSYINSTGIALIVSLLARTRAAQRRMFACGLSDHYVEIFTITRLADFMQVFSDEAGALAEASGTESTPRQAGMD
jgi:anti-sigma B factor antagonist